MSAISLKSQFTIGISACITAERVLIHGGSGGLGTMAIQMLKAWGTEKVVATCSSDR